MGALLVVLFFFIGVDHAPSGRRLVSRIADGLVRGGREG